MPEERKSMTDSNDYALPAGYRLQNYTILSVLGQGGFGITYLAHDEALNQNVAIKEFFPASITRRDPSASTVHAQSQSNVEVFNWGLQRFLEEARILARLSHRNIVRVLSFVPLNNTGYMVMEYEEGDPLDVWVEKADNRDLGQTEVTALLSPVVSALDTVHRLGIAHRDIKPENIYIRADGSPVVLDFGAARNTVGGASKTLAAIVSSGYSPIEQYSDVAEQGAWTDVYATAGVAYFLVTGSAPPDAPHRIDAKHADRDDPCKQLSARDYPKFDQAFLEAVNKGLELRAVDRPQSMEAWHALLLGTEGRSQTGGGERHTQRRARSGGGLLGWSVAGIAVAVAAAGLAFFYTSGSGHLDPLGDSVETAYQIGELGRGTEILADQVGGTDRQDFATFSIARQSVVRIDAGGIPEAVSVKILRDGRAVSKPLRQGNDLVWRLKAGGYQIEIASESWYPEKYKISLAAAAEEVRKPDIAGSSIERAIPIDVSDLMSGRALEIDGKLWRRGAERYYRLDTDAGLALSLTLREATSSPVAISLTGADGLSIGSVNSAQRLLRAELKPGRYHLVATLRSDTPATFMLELAKLDTAAKGVSSATTVLNGSTFASAFPLGSLHSPPAAAPERQLTVPPGATPVFGRFSLDKPAVVRLRRGTGAATYRADVFARQSRSKLASMNADGPRSKPEVDLPKGEFVVSVMRSDDSRDKLALKLELLDRAPGTIDIGELGEQPIVRELAFRDVSGASRAAATFTLPTGKVVSMRVSAPGGGGLIAPLMFMLSDASSDRVRKAHLKQRQIGDVQVPLEPGRYTVELGRSVGSAPVANINLSVSALKSFPDDTHAGRAEDATVLDLTPAGRTQVSEYIGGADSRDMFIVDIRKPGRISIRLNGLTSNADLRLATAGGEQISASRLIDDKPELVEHSLVTGRYSIAIDGHSPWLTPYTLAVRFVPDKIESTPAPRAGAGSKQRRSPSKDQPSQRRGRQRTAPLAPPKVLPPPKPTHVTAEITWTPRPGESKSTSVMTARLMARLAVVSEAANPERSLSALKPAARFKFLEQGVTHDEQWQVSWRGDGKVEAKLTAKVRLLKSTAKLIGKLAKRRIAAQDTFDVTFKAQSETRVGVFAWGADDKVVRIYPRDRGDAAILARPGGNSSYNAEAKRWLQSTPLPGVNESDEAIILIGCQNSGTSYEPLAPIAGQDVDATLADAVASASFLERLSSFCAGGLSVSVVDYTVFNR